MSTTCKLQIREVRWWSLEVRGRRRVSDYYLFPLTAVQLLSNSCTRTSLPISHSYTCQPIRHVHDYTQLERWRVRGGGGTSRRCKGWKEVRKTGDSKMGGKILILFHVLDLNKTVFYSYKSGNMGNTEPPRREDMKCTVYISFIYVTTLIKLAYWRPKFK